MASKKALHIYLVEPLTAEERDRVIYQTSKATERRVFLHDMSEGEGTSGGSSPGIWAPLLKFKAIRVIGS